MKKKVAKALILIGILLVLSSIVLLIHSLWEAKRAAQLSAEVISKLHDEIEESEDNLADSYLKFPEMEMPVIEIDGYRYVGIIRIPSKNIELPVMEECDLTRLKTAPCRYTGTVYARDMVIAGHNYAKHFSPIKQLMADDVVEFEDVLGNCFSYQVIETEVIQPTDISHMVKNEEDEWDLSLFTCTTGGSARFTVRCQLNVDEGL